MINLLPTGTKTELLYARKNSNLLHWILSLFLVLAGIGILVVAGNVFIQYSIRNYSSDIEAGRAKLQEQKIEEVQAKIEDISSSTKLATDVLSSEILFSKLLRQLGASLPPNTVLQQFQVDEVKGGLTLSAQAKDINSATQLQLNLEDPNNKIFEKADIENITCSKPAEGSSAEDNPINSEYPCTVQIRALFSKDNPYTFAGEKP